MRTPIASGTVTYENNLALLDASNMGEGYIMLKYLGSNPKIKVQITKSGSTTYTYDLNNSGVYEVFPLSEGSGSYQVKVFENVSGNQYSQAFSQDVSANITNEFGPFLYPNQYVNFNAAAPRFKQERRSAPDQPTGGRGCGHLQLRDHQHHLRHGQGGLRPVRLPAQCGRGAGPEKGNLF